VRRQDVSFSEKKYMQSQIREWQGSPDMDLVVQHSDSSSPLAGGDAGRVRARRSGVGQAEPCRSDRADNRACVPVHATASVGARSGVSVWNIFRSSDRDTAGNHGDRQSRRVGRWCRRPDRCRICLVSNKDLSTQNCSETVTFFDFHPCHPRLKQA
jgi:hypothetical protein